MRSVGRIRQGVILLCLSLQANADDPGVVFNDAKTYAQETVDGTGGIVSAEKAAALPYYSTSSPVPSLAPGSVGLGSAGIGKINGCEGQNDTECAAVNFLAKNPDTRLRFNLDPATDPSLQAGKQILADPNAVVGAGLDGAENVCSNWTVTDPATFTTEVCNEYKTVGEVVCQKALVVTVTVNESCTPGTWYPAGSGLLTLIDAYCEPDRADGQLSLRFTPDGLHGVCQYGFATVPKAPFTIVAGQDFWFEYVCDEFYCPGYVKHNLLTTAINHWKGACTVPVDIGYGVGAQGCTGDTCTYVFEYQDYRWGHHGVLPTNPFVNPKHTVTETDVWDNQCLVFENRSK
jgi:hypothetical protein